MIIFHRRQSGGNNAVVLNEQRRYKELLEDDSIAKVMFGVKEAIVKLNGRIDIKIYQMIPQSPHTL